MSTKKTRHALSMLGVIAGGSGIMRQAIQDALREVKAIERAAKGVVALGGIQSKSEAMALMQDIAKDAP